MRNMRRVSRKRYAALAGEQARAADRASTSTIMQPVGGMEALRMEEERGKFYQHSWSTSFRQKPKEQALFVIKKTVYSAGRRWSDARNLDTLAGMAVAGGLKKKEFREALDKWGGLWPYKTNRDVRSPDQGRDMPTTRAMILGDVDRAYNRAHAARKKQA